MLKVMKPYLMHSNYIKKYYKYNKVGNITEIINADGNIIKNVDEDNVCVVEYEYDTWVNFTRKVRVDCYVSYFNPFIYKGYFYDSEVNLYYLNSRYYDTSIGRFIFADDVSYLDNNSLSGLNLFAYCGNNPVNYSDGSGHMPKWLSTTLKIVGGVAIIAGCVVGSIFTGGALSVVLAGAAIGAVAGGIGAGISTAVSGGDIHDFANAFLMSTATGAISCAVAASPLGVGAQIGINAALGAVNYAGTQLLSGGNITLGGLLVNAGIGALCGWIGQSGWMQGQTTSAFVAFAGKNALKHVVGMVGTETLLRMTLPAFILGGVGGGIYGRLSSQFNPNGNFIGI